jgi:hypothetical protein
MGIESINNFFLKSGYLVLEPSNFAQMYKFSMRLVEDNERLSLNYTLRTYGDREH